MGWWEALFGPRIDPDSVPAGPVAAFPGALADFPAGPVVRFWYSAHPARADDLAAVHRAMIRGLRDVPFRRRWTGAEYHRRGGFTLRVPDRLSGPVPVWMRDVPVPAGQFPADLIERLLPTPMWLHFDSPRKVRLDPVPAPTPGGRARQRIARVRARGGVPVRAALPQANAALFAPGPDDLPCLVVFGFDERVGDDELRAVARKVSALKNTTPADPELARVAGLTTDETFVYYGRDRLPRAVAGRRELFAGHLDVHRPFLRRRFLDGSEALDCLAEPGERGMLELLPHNPLA